jgi:hypothetical protein
METQNILPILELDELVETFEYKNVRAAKRAIRLGKFPVPTFDLAGRTVAHVDAVTKFFEQKRKEAIEQMENWDDSAVA